MTDRNWICQKRAPSSLFSICRYSKFLCSIQTMNGCSSPYKQWCHSSMARFMASNSHSPSSLIAIGWAERAGKEGTWVPAIVFSKHLGKNGCHPCAQSINIHNKLKSRVRIRVRQGVRENQDAIREDAHVEQVPEDIIHKHLEHRWHVGQAEWHYQVLIVTSGGNEHCLPFTGVPAGRSWWRQLLIGEA